MAVDVRSTLRRTASLLARPVWRRVWARVEARLASVESRLAALERQGGTIPPGPGLASTDLIPPLLARIEVLEHGGAHPPGGPGNATHQDAPLPDVPPLDATAAARLDAAAAAMEHGAALTASLPWRLEALEGVCRNQAPLLANITATFPAFAHALARQEAKLDDAARITLDRLEFVRRELMLELAHGAQRPGAGPKAEARVLAPDKLQAARDAGALRLNLGCGHLPLPGYVNVDKRPLPGVDVAAGADDLPFPPGSVDELHSAHLLEHVPQEALRRTLLPYWASLLRPGGTFRAVTPDGAAMLAGVAAGTYGFDDFREVLFGAQDYADDYHLNLLTPDSLAGLLREAGFCDVQVPVSGRRNGRCFEFEITAIRP